MAGTAMPLNPDPAIEKFFQNSSTRIADFGLKATVLVSWKDGHVRLLCGAGDLRTGGNLWVKPEVDPPLGTIGRAAHAPWPSIADCIYLKGARLRITSARRMPARKKAARPIFPLKTASSKQFIWQNI